uniref:Uncharacterized protein n=1 Tax=Glossina palpalis gambiensis TaxID=67801 RepID=A0A1B0C3M5_9MUSC
MPFLHIMLTNMHDVLSKLLREYPEVWRPCRTSKQGLYDELARRFNEKSNRRPLSRNLEQCLRLLTGCGIARYIREQLHCEECIQEFTMNEDTFCYLKQGRKVARNKLNSLTWVSKYLKPDLPTEEVNEAFQRAHASRVAMLKRLLYALTCRSSCKI